jgi:hypothetical protein
LRAQKGGFSVWKCLEVQPGKKLRKVCIRSSLKKGVFGLERIHTLQGRTTERR